MAHIPPLSRQAKAARAIDQQDLTNPRFPYNSWWFALAVAALTVIAVIVLIIATG